MNRDTAGGSDPRRTHADGPGPTPEDAAPDEAAPDEAGPADDRAPREGRPSPDVEDDGEVAPKQIHRWKNEGGSWLPDD